VGQLALRPPSNWEPGWGELGEDPLKELRIGRQECGCSKLFPDRNLGRGEEGFHQRTFAADRNLRKAFVTVTVRYFRVGVQPSSQRPERIGPNASFLNAFEEMGEERSRNALALDLLHLKTRRRNPW